VSTGRSQEEKIEDEINRSRERQCELAQEVGVLEHLLEEKRSALSREKVRQREIVHIKHTIEQDKGYFLAKKV